MIGLSLCIITKNEEKNIGSCISKFISRAQSKMSEIEILVLDTGSDDGTVDIAKELGAVIYDFVWVNDFSAARNAAIKKAKFSHILFLDADEITEELDIEGVFVLIEQYPEAVGRFKRRNLCNAGNGRSSIMADMVERLFDKRLYHYEEPIHEQLTANDGSNLKVYDIPLTVYHEGYMGTPEQLKAKAERNNKLLEECVKLNPDEPYYYFQLGQSYGICGDFERQLECYRKAYELRPDINASYRPFLITGFGQCLLKTGDIDKLFPLIETEYDNYSDYGDFLCMAGYACMHSKDFEQAIFYYGRAMESSYSHIEGSCNLIPSYNLGCIYEALGNEKDAVNSFELASGYLDADSRKKYLLDRDINKKYISVVLYIDDNTSTELLERILGTISWQSIGMGHLEIIIVNLSGSEPLNTLLSSFEKKNEESVLMINIDDDIDKSYAFEIAARYASSDMIAFLDERCVLKWDYFRFLKECMIKSGADVVCDGIDYVGGTDFILDITDDATRENVRKAGILRNGFIGKVYSRKMVLSQPEYFGQICSGCMELNIADKIYCLGGRYEDITV